LNALRTIETAVKLEFWQEEEENPDDSNHFRDEDFANFLLH